VLQAIAGAEVRAFADYYGGPARVLAVSFHSLDLLVLDAPHLFARVGNPYVAPDGQDWTDNALRFAALSRAGAIIGNGLLPGFAPQVVHAHDWQAGLTPAFLTLAGGRRPGMVMTVHNLAFQGQFPPGLLGSLGLPASAFSMDGVEYYGSIGFLKAGLRFADRITTVSPTYAAEICTPEAGMGLDGLLRGRADVLSGILNGIDDEVWNPASDPRIAARYDTSSLASRAANKRELQARLGLAHDPGALVFGVVSRLSWQKGIDLVLAAVPTILAEGGQLGVLGSGERNIEDALRDQAVAHSGRVGCVFGYDEPLAHMIQAGADVLLVPSRFEPCGLTQLCALRYGAVPLVARVGGLADTVIDANPMAIAASAATGIQFAPVTAEMLAGAIRRAAALYREPHVWRRLQANGMATDVSWHAPARRYAALYRQVAAARAA
jgi:starch synthase